MLKRPPSFGENADELLDSEESQTSLPHKSHHRHLKNHTNRHHRKHDKITRPMTFPTNLHSTTKVTPSERTVVTDQISAIETISLLEEESTPQTSRIDEINKSAIPLTSRPKKPSRRQKPKEFPGNKTDNEEDKNQRRRKNHHHHHHRRNNTLLTNSVHDEIQNTNVSVNTATTTGFQNTIHRNNDREDSLTTEITVAEIASTDKDNQKLEQEIGEQTSTHTESSMFTESSQNSDYDTSKAAITGSFSTIELTTMATTMSVFNASKKLPKLLKNKTTGVLGPARIDVTILEPPDRKHKQGNFFARVVAKLTITEFRRRLFVRLYGIT